MLTFIKWGVIMKRKINKVVVRTFLVIFVLLVVLFLIILYFKRNFVNFDNIVSNIELSVGSKVPSVGEFFNGKNVKGTLTLYYDDWIVESDILNDVGSYSAVILIDDKIYNSTITVKDDEEPLLKLRNLTIKEGDKYNPASFVLACKDNSSRKCIFRFSDTNMQNYTNKGTYDIKIVATDEAFNETEKMTTLTIVDKNSTSSTKDLVLDNGIDTKIEENTKEEYKYGVKLTKKESVFYEIDIDGTKRRVRSKVLSYIDHSLYKANIDDLLSDSIKQVDINKDIISYLFDIINEYRKEHNVGFLNLSEQLNNASTVRVLEIGWSGKFSHTRPNGKNFYSIASDLGYNISILGENIAKDYDNCNDVLAYWNSSLGSNKNIINPSYKNIGIGVTKVDNMYYWVLLFS